MKRYVVVFRSRTDVLSFISDFNFNGGSARAVETPRQAAVGCGISAEITFSQVNLAQKLIKIRKYQSYFGIFRLYRRGSKVIVERI